MEGDELAVRLLKDLLWALEEHARQPKSTVIGFGAVMKRVALDLGMLVEGVRVPRLPRSHYRDEAPAAAARLGGAAGIERKTGYSPKPWDGGS